MIRTQCQHRIDLAFIRELIGASKSGLCDELCADIVITITINLIALCAGIYWAIGKYDTYSLAFLGFLWQSRAHYHPPRHSQVRHD